VECWSDDRYLEVILAGRRPLAHDVRANWQNKKNRAESTLFYVAQPGLAFWLANVWFFNRPNGFYFVEGSKQFIHPVGFIVEATPPQNICDRGVTKLGYFDYGVPEPVRYCPHSPRSFR